MVQFDLYSTLRFTFASIFANIVVVAILAGMVAMTAGLLLASLKQKSGVPVLVYGGILVGVFVTLAAAQFGAIPASFDGVARMGLSTFPAGPVMDVYRSVTGWVLGVIGWLSNAMLVLGLAMLLASRGSDTGVKLVLYGVVIGGIGGLIGTGGIITWIMAFLGVAAPVVA
ncbi:MAG: hypothetical protein GYA24_04145 [Candidatus Lokiarchaeota archaeon]|nr:hypothetical protein [Candidatus Lokiarchaeota archaeon]